MRKILNDAEKLAIWRALGDERTKLEGFFKTTKNPADRASYEVRLDTVVGLIDTMVPSAKVTVEI